MNVLYDLLIHKQPKRQNSWVGNLRWIADEDMSDNAAWNFLVAPMDEEHARSKVCSVKDMIRFRVCDAGKTRSFTYRPDELMSEYDSVKITIAMPFSEYGTIIDVESEKAELEISFSGKFSIKDNDGALIIENQGYYICVICRETLRYSDKGISILISGKTKLVAAFYNNEETAGRICRTLYNDSNRIKSSSAKQWNDYLLSCPLHTPSEELAGRYDWETLKVRQLWHWYAALANISDIKFNRCKTYLAPDRSVWFGSWSNDSPEALAAVSLTSAAPIARKAIIEYIRCAISNEGIHSWYTHADGRSAFGIINDPGRFSQGVLCIIHTVDYYIRATGDRTIIFEDAGGMTVWEKLRKYYLSVFTVRDINNDGLLECANLWESGWDDKICPFFERKSLNEWVEVVTNGSEDLISDFYKEYCLPVTEIVEQVHSLWAVKSMKMLSLITGDEEIKESCEKRYRIILDGVRNNQWNEKTGFYHDRDVKRNRLVSSMNMDAFYFLYFEKDTARIRSMMKILHDSGKFGLKYVPSTSADNPNYSPLGYWSGGYWPREMGYVGMGLYEADNKAEAEKLILDAVMCGEGNEIRETVNPETGKRTTSPIRLAYGSVLIAALLHLDGLKKWS